LAITEKCIQACHLVGITIHTHIIVSMFDDRYYSMADNFQEYRLSERRAILAGPKYFLDTNRPSQENA